MSVIEFPDKRPWMKPQANFKEGAENFVVNSPYAMDLVRQLRSCRSPFIRAAIIRATCSEEDAPFLQRIADQFDHLLVGRPAMWSRRSRQWPRTSPSPEPPVRGHKGDGDSTL
jgi:hypothetical protein